jgi:hypothetical protein
MKNIITISLILMLIQSCTRKNINFLPPKETETKASSFDLPKIETANYSTIECELTTKYSKKERRNMFPFNESKNILLISYKNKDPFFSQKRVIDSFYDSEGKRHFERKYVDVNLCEHKEVIKQWKGDKVGYLKPNYCAIEITKLSKKDIDTLSNLFFNFQLPKNSLEPERTNCYTPRNAILFLDKTDKLIAICEICFECSQTYFSFDKEFEPNLDGYCSLRNQSFKTFFLNKEIKFGAIDFREMKKK